MKIYVLENNYYIGDNPPQHVLDNAQVKEIYVPSDKMIIVENWEVKFVDEIEEVKAKLEQ
jgi:hypothetical protein